MSNIPEDVMDAAARAAIEVGLYARDQSTLRARSEVIARAIMDEAERCARICDEIGSGLMDITPEEAAKAIRRGN